MVKIIAICFYETLSSNWLRARVDRPSYRRDYFHHVIVLRLNMQIFDGGDI